MKESFWAVFVVTLGVITIILINLFQTLTNTDEHNYNLLKETTEAAMVDAIDIGYYRLSGGLYRMDKEKFAESFVRRLAQNVSNDREYDIKFYDINETPPKVTIKIDSSTATSFNGDNLNISNKISSVMETNYKENILTTKLVNSGKLDYSQIDEVYTKALAAS